MMEIHDKMIKGLRRHGAPKKDKGYLRVKVKNLREIARDRKF